MNKKEAMERAEEVGQRHGEVQAIHICNQDKGARGYVFYTANPVPPTGSFKSNTFHYGSRCFHAYERGFRRGYNVTCHEIALDRLALDRRKKEMTSGF